jgi:hypothetical protein
LNQWLNISKVMGSLATRRALFHSEADFQHALAWQVQTSYPSASIRLEVPFRPFIKSGHVDLVVAQAGLSIAIELKYKTRAFTSTTETETFHLKGQSAQDIGRYDFLKDIWRIEKVVSANPASLGLALFLTNDSSYWKVSTKVNSVDAAFRLHEGRMLSGSLSWSAATGAGTMKTRESPLALQGDYPARWTDYSTLPGGGYSIFRYLLVEVIGKDQAA